MMLIWEQGKSTGMPPNQKSKKKSEELTYLFINITAIQMDGGLILGFAQTTQVERGSSGFFYPWIGKKQVFTHKEHQYQNDILKQKTSFVLIKCDPQTFLSEPDTMKLVV